MTSSNDQVSSELRNEAHSYMSERIKELETNEGLEHKRKNHHFALMIAYLYIGEERGVHVECHICQRLVVSTVKD